jgi:plastocyanin
MKHLVLGTLLVGALCVGAASGSLAGPTPESSAAPDSVAAETVHIKDFAYRPTPLKVHVGDRVTFVNDDDEAHTVTATDKRFDSGGLDTNGTWSHTFSEAGTYTYFCALHPYMKATVVVLGSPSPAPTRNDP